ncbi:SAM-dependent methyltransferase [Laspinema olomoucense]|uniref:SAM-dependent methyltransferase n=1 Tax=Laspinema olomoucense TaxID=3231600 RepID=UPI0021BB7F18|nr:class I SAM-dependent methyltransferase [Laspinema sp. D3a]MCT7991172.1 class I SAM-dependent methyltransferase [Laspinema sp. D3a]
MTTVPLNFKTAPGHQILAAAGKTVLRPGGRAATEQLLEWANFQGGETVLELASSFGESAIAIAQRFGVRVVGVEKNPQSVERSRQNIRAAGLESQIEIIEGDIFHLEEIPGEFDYVLAEAILTLQSLPGKTKLVKSIRQKLKPGGKFLSQEMLIRDKEKEIHEVLAKVIRVNSSPLSLTHWQALYAEAGLQVQQTHSGGMELLSLKQLIRDEGLGGTIRIAKNILSNPPLRERVLEMRRTYLNYQNELGYVTFCAIAQ